MLDRTNIEYEETLRNDSDDLVGLLVPGLDNKQRVEFYFNLSGELSNIEIPCEKEINA